MLKFYVNSSPAFKIVFPILVLIFGMAMMASVAHAETKVTPYLSLGAWHRDCSLTDPMICNNDAFGSDTPGTIDIGFRLEPNRPRFYYLYADEVDIGWHHQSYIDRGWLIPGLLDFGGEESQIDMYGARFTWEFETLSFTLPF